MSTVPATPATPVTPATARNGFGITALVTALVGLVFGLIPLTGFVALILGMIAVVFGLLGIARVRKHIATNKVMSWIGTTLGAGAIALGIWGMVTVFQATDKLVNDLEQIPPPPGVTNVEPGSNSGFLPETAPMPEVTLPTPEQFDASLVTTSQHCYDVFGECDLMVQVELTYTGTQPVEELPPMDVTYTISGTTNGDVVGTLSSLNGTDYSGMPEMISIPQGSTPTVTVTDIR